MSNAVRVTTWRAMFAAFGVDPETADEGARRVCHDAALNYARACGYKPPEAGPQRVATGARSAVAGDGWTFRFGKRCVGKRPDEVTVSDLRFYEKCALEALDNPEKQRWRDSNQRDLDVIRAELQRRGEAANHG